MISICFVYDCFLLEAPLTFIEFKIIIIIFISTSIGKFRNQLEINLVYFVIAQFHSKKAMNQSPCFDIEY